MINLQNIIALLVAHWLGDFVLQSDDMAIRKSKDNAALFSHCFVTSVVLLVFGWKMAVFNGVTHFMIDYVTSRVNAKLWTAKERHWFFVDIGFDQMLHLILLFGSFIYIK